MHQALRISGSFGIGGLPTTGDARMWIQFDDEPPIEVYRWTIFDSQNLTIISTEQGFEMTATMGRHLTCTYQPVGSVETVKHHITTLKTLPDPNSGQLTET